MKRFLCDGMKLYYDSEEEIRETFPEVETIVEIEDTEHLPYINKILGSAINNEIIEETENDLTLYYLEINTVFGICQVFLRKDARDDKFYDYIKYRLFKAERLVEPILWDISTPEIFVQSLLIDKPKYFVLARGNKVGKPSKLRGVHSVGKAIFFTKATCNFFVLGDDVYIQHTDYFSPTLCREEDIGTPLRYRLDKYGVKGSTKDFVYPDSWGEIVLRQKAWIKIENGYPLVKIYNPVQCAKSFLSLMKEYHKDISFTSEEDCVWLRFFEEGIKSIKDNEQELTEVS